MTDELLPVTGDDEALVAKMLAAAETWPGHVAVEAMRQVAARHRIASTRPDSALPRPTFPILGSGGAKIDLQLVADHGKQAQANHYQTVARLAERGGLSWCEVYAVLHNRKYEKIDTNEAMLACRELEARYLAAFRQPAPRAECMGCCGLNTSCPEGCGRDPATGELDGSRCTCPAHTPCADDALRSLLRRCLLYTQPPREAHHRFAEDWRDARESYDSLIAEVRAALAEEPSRNGRDPGCP